MAAFGGMDLQSDNNVSYAPMGANTHDLPILVKNPFIGPTIVRIRACGLAYGPQTCVELPESPFLLDVLPNDCPLENEVPNALGECVCDAGYTRLENKRGCQEEGGDGGSTAVIVAVVVAAVVL
eukprot:7574237-Pyramimonas_sp.AAC.1